jgi:hypothetical chaperone protein
MIGIGIDFGTSNSSAAIFDGKTLHSVALEPDGEPDDVMPTALYLDRERHAEIGRAAIDAYVRENAGRSVSLVPEVVGEIEITFTGTSTTPPPKTLDSGDGESYIAEVHAYTDQDLPGRLFRGVKRWLGSRGLDRVRVFDASYRLVALITPVLTHLRTEAARACRGESNEVYVGRPVNYEGGADRQNELAVERMREACQYAGLGRFELYPEPIAAVASFVIRRQGPDSEIVLAFDFGGGTLDLSVVKRRGDHFDVLATHGDGVGGDEINRMIYRRAVFPELGDGSSYHVPVSAELKRVPFPFREFGDRLLNWTLAYELNRPELCELMAQGRREPGEAGRRIGRLFELVTENRSYQVFQAIESAKLALSETHNTHIAVPDLELDVPVTRSEFESWLAPVLDRVRACIDGVLDRAGLDASAVDVVVRTGGSSRIPAVIDILEDRFPGKVVEHDPFTSIAAGLAIASYNRYAANTVNLSHTDL